MSTSAPNLRLVRAAPDPLGLYLRVTQVGQKDLQTFLSSRGATFNGVVFEARRWEKQKELLAQVLEKKMDAVLDPQTQAMATPGGYSEKMNGLRWSLGRMHKVEDYTSALVHKAVDEIAQFAVAHGFTQVIAPTHLITDADDPWLAIDLVSVRALRLALQRRGGSAIQVNYSLALPYATFRNATKRDAVIDRLRGVEIDSLWLNVDGCGSDMSPTGVVRYSDAATSFHSLGVPVIADHMGGLVGLSLLAFGAVGGLCHGITMAERWSAGHWLKPKGGKAFAQKVRVYLADMDLLLPRDDAEQLFESGGRAKSAYGCRNNACCARGIADMVQAPVRHFLHQRIEEIAGLGRIPESLRARQFLEQHLRPATDKAILGPTLQVSDKLRKKLADHSKRLNDLRIVLGDYVQDQRTASYSPHPKTRAARGGA